MNVRSLYSLVRSRLVFITMRNIGCKNELPEIRGNEKITFLGSL